MDRLSPWTKCDKAMFLWLLWQFETEHYDFWLVHYIFISLQFRSLFDIPSNLLISGDRRVSQRPQPSAHCEWATWCHRFVIRETPLLLTGWHFKVGEWDGCGGAFLMCYWQFCLSRAPAMHIISPDQFVFWCNDTSNKDRRLVEVLCCVERQASWHVWTYKRCEVQSPRPGLVQNLDPTGLFADPI